MIPSDRRHLPRESPPRQAVGKPGGWSSVQPIGNDGVRFSQTRRHFKHLEWRISLVKTQLVWERIALSANTAEKIRIRFHILSLNRRSIQNAFATRARERSRCYRTGGLGAGRLDLRLLRSGGCFRNRADAPATLAAGSRVIWRRLMQTPFVGSPRKRGS